jgi:hypothetical protein
MKLHSDLRAFIESLNSANVKYVIVGGYAVSFHGHPRFTGDIDFFVAHTRENAEAIVSAIENFGFGSLGLKPHDFTESDSIVQLGYPPNRIDLITGIDGVTFDEAWASRIVADLEGLPVCFLSKDLLLRNKRAVDRPKDRGDVDML